MATRKKATKKAGIIEIPMLPADIRNRDFQWEVNENVIIYDGGNGKALAYRLLDGKLQRAVLPNARVPVSGYKLSKDVTSLGASEVFYADFMGERHALGDLIWEVSDADVESFMNSTLRYGSPLHIEMFLVLCAKMDIPSGSAVTVVVSAPPGMVSDVAKQMKRGFMMGDSNMKDGIWHIKLSSEQDEREYRIAKVVVIPEGPASYAAFAFDANGNNVDVPGEAGDDLLTGVVTVADGGQGTFDIIRIVNGNLSEGQLLRATDADGGINTHMIQPLKTAIEDEFRQAQMPVPRLSDAQIDYFLRLWAHGNFKDAFVKVSGRRLNIAPHAAVITHRYTEWLIRNKFERMWRDGADTVILTGGVWIYVLPYILKAYPKRNILYPAKVAHLEGIEFYELNAYGGLPLIANNQKIHRMVNR